MTTLRLIARSLVFHRRTNLGVVAGSAVATAILVGALVVGDSVRITLQGLVEERLGSTVFVLEGGERTFRRQLAEDLDSETPVAPVLITRGVGLSGDRRLRVNNVQVVGVDSGFWGIGSVDDPLADARHGSAAVNRHLAARLALAGGDEMLLRIRPATAVPGSFALGAVGDSKALTLDVAAVLDDGAFGRFGLRDEQVAPLTVFVPIEALGEAMGLRDRANLLLAGRGGAEEPDPEELTAALDAAWTLRDAGLVLRSRNGAHELLADSIFVDPAAVEAVGRSGVAYSEVLTYLVNSIEAGNRATPYSFVASPGSGVAETIGGDEVIVNQWLAEDLGVGPGARIRFRYFVPTTENGLTEESAEFTVHSVVPIGPGDAGLMPSIPGLEGKQDCRDWDAGIPIDFDRVRERDEAYWDDHGGAPKAFLNRAAARRLWENRYGSATALRFPADAGTAEGLEKSLSAAIGPRTRGLEWRDVRFRAETASSHGVDFGQLFVSLSFFIVIAAVLLIVLLHRLAVTGRASETGILGAVGIPPAQVRRLILGEGLCLAVAGGLAGVPLGLAYNVLILDLLASVWRGAVAAATFDVHVRWPTVAAAFAGGCLAAIVAIAFASRQVVRRRPIELLAGWRDAAVLVEGKPGRWNAVAAAICFAGVVAILVVVGPGRGKDALGAFWGAGFLMLAASLFVCRWGLLALPDIGGRRVPSLHSLGRANAGRKATQSLTSVALLAFGVFIILAVGANRISPPRGTVDRSAGTGGFAVYAETTMPVRGDLGSPAELKRLGLDQEDGLAIVPLRRREGSDASCLNLNRVTNPPILGVDPREFGERGAFRFAALDDSGATGDPWSVLERDLGPGVVPAVADQTVIVWGLGLGIGGEIETVDEHGRPLRLRLVGGLANSVFQGHLLISESRFLDAFPSSRGAEVLLVDAPPERVGTVLEAIGRGLRDFGVVAQPAADRLASFAVVENTYLTIFLVLGGFGVMLGTVGLGVVVLRNVMAERSHLAVLRAIGLSRKDVRRVLLHEYLPVLAAGLGGGAVAAFVAVLPALLAPGASIPFALLALMSAAILACGFISVWIAARLATAGNLVAALRDE